MECRDARCLIEGLERLREPERRLVEAHVRACAACRDELEDSETLVLRGVELSPALPSPNFSGAVLLRLPAASPLAIARKERRVRRLAWIVGAAGIVALTVAAFLGQALLQNSGTTAAGVVQGMLLPLALTAKAVLIAAGRSWLSMIAAIALALAPPIWQRFVAVGVPRWTLLKGSAMAAGTALSLLLLTNVAVLDGDVGTLGMPLEIRGRVDGDVASLVGDIAVDGEVLGDVIALGGRVSLGQAAVVHGSVLAGAGMTGEQGARVAQRQFEGGAQWPALAWAARSSPGGSVTSAIASQLAAAGAGLIMFLLAALVVVAWPEWPAAAGLSLVRFPRRALLLGAAASLGVIGLALAVSVLLAATVAGVVVVPILLLILHLPFVGGIAAVGNALGLWLTGGSSIVGGVWGVAIQLLLLLAVGLLFPTASVLGFYLLASAGLGGNLLVSSEEI